MSNQVLVDVANPLVTTLTLHRPEKRNALSVDLILEMTASIRTANADRTRRVLILKGAGPVFCAGLDLKEASDPARADQSAHALADLYSTICEAPLVTIAVAQGAAFGGGAGLLASCDLVVASEDLRIGFPEVHRGLVAALVTCMVRRQVGERAVRELVLLGRSVPAAEALLFGLVNSVVPAEQLAAKVDAIAAQACKGAPGAIARTKRLLDDLAHRPIAEDLRRALAYHLQARESAEATEGVTAFLERREPRWGARPESS